MIAILIAKRRFLNLDCSRSIEVYDFSIYRHLAILASFSHDLSWSFQSFHHPNSSKSLQTSSPSVLRSQDNFFSLVRLFLIRFFMHFIFCDLTFGVCWKTWGFSKLKRLLQNFWDEFCLFAFKTSCIASHVHYNNVSCI